MGRQLLRRLPWTQGAALIGAKGDLQTHPTAVPKEARRSSSESDRRDPMIELTAAADRIASISQLAY